MKSSAFARAMIAKIAAAFFRPDVFRGFTHSRTSSGSSRDSMDTPQRQLRRWPDGQRVICLGHDGATFSGTAVSASGSIAGAGLPGTPAAASGLSLGAEGLPKARGFRPREAERARRGLPQARGYWTPWTILRTQLVKSMSRFAHLTGRRTRTFLPSSEPSRDTQWLPSILRRREDE
jgi:hypothetical protein